MNSKSSKMQWYISLIIIVLLIALSIWNVIPGWIALTFVMMDFIYLIFVLPVILVNGIRTEYKRSFEDSSYIEMTLVNHKDEANDSPRHGYSSLHTAKTFYPRKSLVSLFIVVSLALLSIVNFWTDNALFDLHISIQETDVSFIIVLVLLFIAVYWVYLVRKRSLVIDKEGIATFFMGDLTSISVALREKIHFTDLTEINIKKNKYISHKNQGVIFEFVKKDGTKHLFISQIFSDRQRSDIIQSLQENIK